MTSASTIGAGAAVLGTSTGTTFVLIVIAGVLSLAWLVSLVVLVLDTISVGAKIVWFLALRSSHRWRSLPTSCGG
jgi:hypothetical protein